MTDINVVPAPKQRLHIVTVRELIEAEFPPRENLLSPWLPRQGLAMIHAPRGVGKTFLALWIAHTVATGGRLLKWCAEKPAGVLFLDGEMPGVILQDRVQSIIESADEEPTAPLNFFTPDLHDGPMPNLATERGQRMIDDAITNESLIIVDNISTLATNGKENEAESWQAVQAWALDQRSKDRSVLFIHHSGKGGAQRGTSKREDVLDTVINLRRPSNYSPAKGAIFQIHFEKSRGFYGKDAEPLEACLVTDENDRQSWAMSTLEESTADQVIRLAGEGFNQAAIAKELDVNRSTVCRHWNKAVRNGFIQR